MLAPAGIDTLFTAEFCLNDRPLASGCYDPWQLLHALPHKIL